MHLTTFLPRPLAAGLCLGLALAGAAPADTPIPAEGPERTLARTIAAVEGELGARVGLVLHDTGSGRRLTHRADERMPMNSTVKTAICGAVLSGAETGSLQLDEALPVMAADILAYAPVTSAHVGGTMTLAALCLATLDQSDNTAANLLITRLGGPQAVTGFLRRIGDPVSRVDRMEPALNDTAPGDPRDTTTPRAMADTWQALLLGPALGATGRARLADWMSHGGGTAALLRRDAPEGWQIVDKSGAGARSRNLVAMITPPGRAPWIAAIYIAEAEADFATRNAALQRIGRAVVGVIAAP